MIMVNLVVDVGKEVFVIFGNIKYLFIEGLYYLIQQGVKLMMCVVDMLEEFGIELVDICDEEVVRQQGLVFELVSGLFVYVDMEFISVDDLVVCLGLFVFQVMVDMFEYELVGKVFVVFGGYVCVS